MKLQTPVEVGKSAVRISFNDRILLLGSCFSDEIGGKMHDYGFDVQVNPFGPLYNPVSVCNSISRLASSVPFSEDECVRMGAGSELICSFSHHTAAARPSVEEFLADANSGLQTASKFFLEADTVIITLGTSWVFRRTDTGDIVSNCLKRNASEFTRERLPLKQVIALLESMVSRYSSPSILDRGIRPKRFIFTVSPIRHLKDGAHGNQVSKSTLLLAVDSVCQSHPDICQYFPAYEIVMDELRDYRFYAEDMLHPSAQTVNYIWERFCDFALPDEERPVLERNRKDFLRSRHRPMFSGSGI